MEFYAFLLGLAVSLLPYTVYARFKKRTFQKGSISLSLVEQSKDIIYYYELKPVYKHKYTSPSVDLFLGEGTLEALYRDSNTPFEMIHPDDRAIMDQKISGKINYDEGIIQRLKGTNGVYRWFEEYTTPIYENGEIVAVQGIMRNIDDKIKLEQDLHYRVSHDALTTVYNRDYFEQMMTYYNQEENVALGLVLCDLDRLKHANDTYGHKIGDQLIQTAAGLLKSIFSDNAIVSRIGGDEFVILLPTSTPLQIEHLCDQLREKVSHAPSFTDALQLHMSIGVAFSEQSFGKTESLYIEADAQMYEDKRQKSKQFARLY